MAQGNGMYLTRSDQAAKDFTHLAAGSKRGQEQLNLFHAGGDNRLQVDRSKH
jgi:hypothetical protein